MAEPASHDDVATAERVARNDAVFRDANEKIGRAADEHSIDGAIPFICECANPECRDIVLVTRADYQRIRSNPVHFLNAPGHEVAAKGWARVVADHGHYVTVEKIGRAGEVATELDPRS